MRPRILLLRLAVLARRAARRCVGGAVYGFSLTWTLGYIVLYSPLAWLAAGVMMLATAVVAATAIFVSGE